MFQKILMPVDVAHPEDGERVLEVAMAVTSPDAAFTLLYVMEDIPNWTDLDLPADFKKNSMQTARQALSKIAEKADRPVQVEVLLGHAYSTILEHAEAAEIDLIILSSHKPGLKDYFIGSNTTKIVGHAKCSVVVAR